MGRKRKKSKESPPNKDTEKRRVNMEPLSQSTTGNYQNGQPQLRNINGGYNQTGQCYSPIQNFNPAFSLPGFYTPGGQGSPNMTQTYIPQSAAGNLQSDQLSVIIQRLEKIDNKLTQLETIQSTVNKITERLESLDRRVSTIESRMHDIEQSRMFDSQSLDDI
jgi:tetrahydromethanopterin S-methyltransferase subunit G